MILRPYQDRALADVTAAYRAGHKGVVLVLPTGAAMAGAAAVGIAWIAASDVLARWRSR